MTHKERVLASLNNEKVDQLPCEDTMWGETSERYQKEGSMLHGEDVCRHFDMSWRADGWITPTIIFKPKPESIFFTGVFIMFLKFITQFLLRFRSF